MIQKSAIMQMFKFILTNHLKWKRILSSTVLIEIISYLLIMLFLYAAISKLVIFNEFQGQMEQSPLLPRQFIPFLAVFVPLMEFIVAWMLVFDKTKLIGFYLSFSVMLIFTLYLITLVTVAENAPCSCGGILGQMGYREHILFNIFFTGIALYGSLKLSSKKN